MVERSLKTFEGGLRAERTRPARRGDLRRLIGGLTPLRRPRTHDAGALGSSG